MKVLVVHGSRSGWAQEVAGHAADALRADGHEVSFQAAGKDVALDGADAVLLFAGVRANNLNAEAAAWLVDHADELRALTTGVASVSLSAADRGGKGEAGALAVIEALLSQHGLDTCPRAALTGGYDPDRVNFAERMIMKAMKTEPCNLVDPAAAAAFAREVVAG